MSQADPDKSECINKMDIYIKIYTNNVSTWIKKSISHCIFIFFLQIIELAASNFKSVDIEFNYENGRLFSITAYFGSDLCIINKPRSPVKCSDGITRRGASKLAECPRIRSQLKYSSFLSFSKYFTDSIRSSELQKVRIQMNIQTNRLK